MSDVLARLDAAIEELGHENGSGTSRCSREVPGTEVVTGPSKDLKHKEVPVIPVVPAAHDGSRGNIDRVHACASAQGAVHAATSPAKIYINTTGLTGLTGSLQDSCGVRSSRNDLAYGNNGTSVAGLAAARGETPDPESPAAWRTWYAERIRCRHRYVQVVGEGRAHRRVRPHELARRIAFDETLWKWCLAHPEAHDTALCAGCGRLLAGAERLHLSDGAAVHLAVGYACLIAYGTRRRQEALQALRAFGIAPPPGWAP